ncbi:MAG TPA: polysaccharide deacetylase family protein [Chthonomonadaceae bacterium]|nr:polysaccharide deacetylase family protein [Chthonomonadaceae bacterium]
MNSGFALQYSLPVFLVVSLYRVDKVIGDEVSTLYGYTTVFLLTMKRRHHIQLIKALLLLSLTLGGLSLAASALSWHGFTFVEWWREGHSGLVLWKADTGQKCVALTFDDGPDPRYTPRILAILRRYGARATFFEVGRQVQAYPALARAVAAQGNVIGNHTYSHPYLDRKPGWEVAQEIAQCDSCLEAVLGRHSYLFRPPRGDWNPTIFREVRRRGDHLILWTFAVEHREARTPQAMAARALRLVRPGSILLMHDGADSTREKTVQALPLILEGLRARGYRCVTVPELLRIRGASPLPAIATSQIGSRGGAE